LFGGDGVAFVSRVRRTFRTTSPRDRAATGREDGIRTASGIRWIAVSGFFEDQRSGETLGKLQKVRSDVDDSSPPINVLFISVVGIVFVMVMPPLHWSIAATRFWVPCLTGNHQFGTKPKIKKIQKTIVAETTPCRIDDGVVAISSCESLGLAHQEVVRSMSQEKIPNSNSRK